MNIGIIGIGKMGKFHAKTVLNNKDVNLTGVYDIDKNVSQNFVKEHEGLKIFNNLNEIVSENDAIIIATPDTTHYQIIKEVYLISKINILCEKPITHRIEDYLTLFFQNLSSPYPIHIGLCERHGELIPFIKSLDFDKIDRITFVRHNTGNRNTDVNLVLDTMVHDIDLLYYLFPLFKVDKLKLKKEEYIDKELKHLICSTLNGKITFDCGKGMEEMQRYLKVVLKDGSTIKYDFLNLTIEYGTGYSTIIKAEVQQNKKDKLTIQFENFISNIRGEVTNNADLYNVDPCMTLMNNIQQLLKK